VFDIGIGEFLGIAVIALLVLGPDKLPKFAADAAKYIRQFRRMAQTAREDVRRELGPELQGISLENLNPRSVLRKHLLDDDADVTAIPADAQESPPRPRLPPSYDPDTT
jgi:sec-independent protein translocase protein TatB